MRDQSYRVVFAALVCLVTAWGVLFAGQILEFGWAAAVPKWVLLVLLFVSGLLVAVSRRSVRTRSGIGTAILLTVAALAAVQISGRDSADLEPAWWHQESQGIVSTLVAVGDEITRLEEISTSVGERITSFVRDGGFDDDSGLRPDRFETFELLGKLAEQISNSGALPPGTEIGIQLFDADGERLAWSGWPQTISALDRAYMDSGAELIYSREVSLYRILSHMIPINNEGGERVYTVLVDLPLEVNYRVNNRFLKSAGIADNIASGRGGVANIRFEYAPTMNNLPHRLERFKRLQRQYTERQERRIAQRAHRAGTGDTDQQNGHAPESRSTEPAEVAKSAERDSVLSYYPFPAYIEPLSEIYGEAARGLEGRVLIRSALSNPIVTVTVVGHPFRHYVEQYQSRWLTWAKAFVVLVLLVMFIVAMLALGRHGYHAWLRGAVFVGFLVLLRYSLLSFRSFGAGTGRKIFDPTVFATPLLGGIMRSAGDLLITGVVYVVAIYGLMKMIRSRERTSGEMPSVAKDSGESRGPTSWGFMIKGPVVASVLFAAYWLTRAFASVMVVNANPRLIGETMQLTDTSVLTLHLGTFLTMSGILLSGLVFIWGLFRLTGWRDAVKSSWTAFVILVVVTFLRQSWDLAPIVGVLLLFAILAPRFVHREDLVSIAIVSFCLVIITSGLTYFSFTRNYDGLRKSFVLEKAREMNTPSDNWKVVILEDILNDYSHMPRLRRVLKTPQSSDAQRLAFDLWADGPLSLLGYSCAIHVLTDRDSVVSDFTVDMPYRTRLRTGGERVDTPVENDWVVLDLTRVTPQGIVRFYRGIVNVEEERPMVYGSPLGGLIGKIVVDLPFFFESLEWTARTGPRTPEVLRNVQEGGVSPRVEEPEALLLARCAGRRIYESSSESLPVGVTISSDLFERGLDNKWPLLSTSRGSYRFLIVETDEPEQYLLAGFAVPSPIRHLIRWSTLFSLYLFFTAFIIAAIVFLNTIPYLKELLPTLTPGRKFGFQQKLLASFLIVALAPAVILGLFSVDFIKDRFVEENKQEAVDKLYSARKALVNLLQGELQLFLAEVDASRLFTEEGYAARSVTSPRLVEVFTESGTAGPIPIDKTGSRVDESVGQGERADGRRPRGLDLSEASTEDLYMYRVNGDVYIGVLSAPMQVSGLDWAEDFFVYYAKRVNAELLGDIADQIGADLNVFGFDGNLVASSQEGLLAGGLISATMNHDSYVKVSLLGSNIALATESAGRYSYQVAYLPITSWRPHLADDDDQPPDTKRVRAAMSVPLVFLPEFYSIEIQKATSIVLGIFALLFLATIGLGLLLARGVFEPLRALLDGTRRISRGDLNVRLPMRRSDEIGIVVSAFNEMTEQLSESQRALEERRRYLETILANIGTGVISTDTDDRIRNINSAAERILGIEAHEAMGQTAAEMVEQSIAPEIFRILRDGRQSLAPFLASEVELLRDGRRATVKYMLTQINAEDRYLGSVFVFEDLTELIQTKKLSAWVEMARQIAHEIKNPLTPIRISTQFMQRAYEQKSEKFDQIFKEGSDTIIQQVDVLKRIAGEFSSYGRMQHLDVAPHRLSPLLDSIVTPYFRNSSGVVVDLQNTCPDAEVLIDTEAVRKICTNLIENAMDAMPDGGRLDISCGRETVNGSEFVRVSFCDTGPGLSEEAEEKLFEPYFSTKTTGTGLGLAICRSLSQEMGGEIDVRNRVSGGVVASLLLEFA